MKMIYLDYSATTPVNSDVLNTFNEVTNKFIGNANSLHKLGVNANRLIESATEQIKDLLNIKDKEIIYTSSSSEAINLAIKGIAFKYQNRGKHIITTHFEHSSVYGALDYLEKLGYEISYVSSNQNGLVNLDNLKELLRDDTILVVINAINSEIGIKQPIEEIGNIISNYKAFYMVDLTQSIGKVNINLDRVDLGIFSSHKIYGLKGIACLFKNKNILLEPLIHGGKSTTIYRSGTPNHPMIASISKALRLALENLDNKYNYVKELNNYLKDNLQKFKDVYINSNEYSIPHILNISIVGIKAETMMHALEEEDIYVSTKSACSDNNSKSESVYYLTNDIERAKSSIRISISHLTTKNEIDKFLTVFKDKYNKLKMN